MAPRARPRRRPRPAPAALCLALLAHAAGAGAEGGGPPAEGACPVLERRAADAADAPGAPLRLHEGMRLPLRRLPAATALLPPEVWRQRDQFFRDGAVLELGACHRRYAVPAFFARATADFAPRARLDADGNLLGHVAGLPFPPEAIDPAAPDAGLRWAWNLARRYRGAGPAGSFRLVDMPSRVGEIEVYLGSWFWLQTGQRADLPESGYAEPAAPESSWIAGGRFDEPSGVRHLAWRQLRPPDAASRYATPDDTFVYVPGLRKVRRAGSAWVDGLFVPRYRAGGDGGGRGPAADALAATENLRRGFAGLTLRPNAYRWRLLGLREVLAPLNVGRSGYPDEPRRGFGASGLALSGERFDVRYAAVIQGALREPGQAYDLLTLYVDTQTQQPLYLVAKRRDGQLVEVGILLHRYSGDVPGYPPWPDGGEARVFDPVAAVFREGAEGGSGWRRESYDVRSVPRDAAEIRRLASPGSLARGR